MSVDSIGAAGVDPRLLFASQPGSSQPPAAVPPGAVAPADSGQSNSDSGGAKDAQKLAAIAAHLGVLVDEQA